MTHCACMQFTLNSSGTNRLSSVGITCTSLWILLSYIGPMLHSFNKLGVLVESQLLICIITFGLLSRHYIFSELLDWVLLIVATNRDCVTPIWHDIL